MTRDTYSAKKTLQSYGKRPDQDIHLTEAALSFAALWHHSISIDKYRNHIQTLISDLREAYATFMHRGDADDVHTKVAALKHVFVDRHDYSGDSEQYDDLQNADLMRVIDRRKGLPIALAILVIEAGRAQGWAIDGLNFPGHFLVRVEQNGQRVIFDPFGGFKVMEAADLRALLKRIAGPAAELSVKYYDPASNRDILIRLQNNIKMRQIESEDYAGALKTVEAMQWIDPEETRLLFDAGILYARTNQPKAAVESLQTYLEKAASPEDRYDAQMILNTLLGQIN